MAAKKQETKAVIGIGTVVRLKSDGPKDRRMTVVGFDTFKGSITVIWSSGNGNMGKAEIPALAVNVVKS